MLQKFNRLLIGVSVLTLFTIQTGCVDSKAADEEKGATTEPAKRINVRTKTIAPAIFTNNLQLVGEVEAKNDAVLSGQISVVLKEIRADKGTYVQKGDTILILDDKRFRAFYKMAFARYENSRIDFETAKELFENGLGVSKNQYQKAENALMAAEADLLNAEVDLEHCVITAPFKGEIAELYKEFGELVSPGMPLLRLVDNNALRVRAGVPENQAGFIRKGALTKVSVPNNQLELEGKIIWIGATLEPRSRTIPIEISINSDKSLKPGMVVEVEVEKFRIEQAIVVPLSVVQKAPDHSYVYTHENGLAKYQSVTVDEIDHNMVLITSGLQFGDELIIDGYRDLVDNQAIDVVGKNDEN